MYVERVERSQEKGLRGRVFGPLSDKVLGPQYDVALRNQDDVDNIVEFGTTLPIRTLKGVRVAIAASSPNVVYPLIVKFRRRQLERIEAGLRFAGDTTRFYDLPGEFVDSGHRIRLESAANVIDFAIHPRTESHIDDWHLPTGSSTPLPPASGE